MSGLSVRSSAVRWIPELRYSFAETRCHIPRSACRTFFQPAYQQSLIEGGFEPTLDSNPEKFRQSLAADVALWAPVVKSLGLKLD
jgi:hypothetical protein